MSAVCLFVLRCANKQTVTRTASSPKLRHITTPGGGSHGARDRSLQAETLGVGDGDGEFVFELLPGFIRRQTDLVEAGVRDRQPAETKDTNKKVCECVCLLKGPSETNLQDLIPVPPRWFRASVSTLLCTPG